MLTAILAFYECGPGTDWTSYPSEISHLAGDRAERLTTQLLGSGSRSGPAIEVVNLNEIVLDLHSLLGRLLGEEIHLIIETAADLRPTRADPGHVEQLLMHLVVNARDATPHGGTIRIATCNVTLDAAFVMAHPDAVPGEYVALSIEDTGHGIPPQILEHIFEPFFTTKGAGIGTGLGLPTVHGIVTESRGYISVDTHPGAGHDPHDLPAGDRRAADRVGSPRRCPHRSQGWRPSCSWRRMKTSVISSGGQWSRTATPSSRRATSGTR